jgi:excisionase family DNA binding protein
LCHPRRDAEDEGGVRRVRPGRAERRRGLKMETLSPSEFADAVGVDPSTVRRWIKSKYIKSSRVGPRGHIRIPANQLERAGVAEPAPRPKRVDIEAIIAEMKARVKSL